MRISLRRNGTPPSGPDPVALAARSGKVSTTALIFGLTAAIAASAVCASSGGLTSRRRKSSERPTASRLEYSSKVIVPPPLRPSFSAICTIVQAAGETATAPLTMDSAVAPTRSRRESSYVLRIVEYADCDGLPQRHCALASH